MDRVLQHLSRPSHSSRHDEGKVPGIHGPKARWKVPTGLFKAIQPPGVVCAGSSGHEREQEELLHGWPLYENT
jgi:hypothetical protein